MSFKRIVILGNSVPLKIRPPRRHEGDRTYAEILRDHGWQIENRSRAATTISEGYHWFDDDVLSAQPDYLFIHYGIVEACLRRNFRHIHHATFRNIYPNQALGRSYQPRDNVVYARILLARAISFLVEKIATVCMLKWRWMSDAVFMDCLREIVRLALKETRSHIVIVGITPCNQRIQRHLPGSKQSISILNEKMRSFVHTCPLRVHFLDVAGVVHGYSLDEVVPDGIHFSAQGHQLLAAALEKVIVKLEKGGLCAL